MKTQVLAKGRLIARISYRDGWYLVEVNNGLSHSARTLQDVYGWLETIDQE